MKKIFFSGNAFALFISILFCNLVNAQVTLVIPPPGVDNCSNPLPNAGPFTVQGSLNGKNLYYSNSGGSNLKLFWNSTKLQWEVDATDPATNITSVCWHNSNNTPLPPDQCWVADFGCFAIYFTGNVSTVVQSADIELLSNIEDTLHNIVFQAVFSAGVAQNLSTSNFQLDTGGTISGATITSVTMVNSNTFNINVNTGNNAGEGTVGLIMASNPTGTYFCGLPYYSNSYYTRCNSLLKPVVSITSTSTKICAGSSVTFTATTQNTSGPTTFDWNFPGQVQSVNNYTVNNLTNGSSVNCRMTTNSCGTPGYYYSNYITISVLNTSSVTNVNYTGGSYTFNGQTFNHPGTYTVHLTNSAGCDSAATLNLYVQNAAPDISYISNAWLNENSAITPIVPFQGSGKVPASIPFGVRTLAGTGTTGKTNGTGTSATFNFPSGIAKDGMGNLYIADTKNYLIRMITRAGVVSTLAGDGWTGILGGGRLKDGNGTAASFDYPTGLVVSGDTCLYVADNHNNVIRKISLTSPYRVTTFAGLLNGNSGDLDATGNAAKFNNPQDITIDKKGNLYVADNGNNKIRKITPAAVVTTFAGLQNGNAGSTDATGTSASFNSPTGLAFDSAGNLYVADKGNFKIRKISPAAVVTTFAGSGTAATLDGTGIAAELNGPECITVDKYNNLYVTEYGNVIRKITPNALVTTIAGSGVASSVNNTIGTSATFNQPAGITLDMAGDTIYVAEALGENIRTISLTGYTISPVLPNGLNFDATTGTISGVPTVISPMTSYLVTATNTIGSDTASVSIKVCAATSSTDSIVVKANQLPYSWNGLTFSSAGTQTAHIANAAGCDSAATLILNVAPGISYAGAQVDTVGAAIKPLVVINKGGVVPAYLKNYVVTFAGNTTSGFKDGQDTSARFLSPQNVAIDPSGNLFVSDIQQQPCIRKITPSGLVSTFATGFIQPKGITTDASGNVYVADIYTGKITKITQNGIQSVIATLNSPSGIGIDLAGNLYVAEYFNNWIKKIDNNGTVSIYAGTGAAGYKDSTRTLAIFYYPTSLTVDAHNNIYVTDGHGYVIRKISASGIVTTIASYYMPSTNTGIISDKIGNIYYADQGNEINKIDTSGVISKFAGAGYGFGNGDISLAKFNVIAGIALDNSGNMFIADQGNAMIRKISNLGYSINPALPAGLILDSTGTISGTPTVASAATTYTVVASNQYGSDTTTVNITVNPACTPTSSSTSLNICSNALPYSWNGLTFTAAGTQTAHLTNARGCDSAATLVLSIKPNSTFTTYASVCIKALPYIWNGRSYNSAMIDTIHYTSNNGCDSVEILNLNILPQPPTTTTYHTACGSYTWNGTTYTSSGTYIHTALFGNRSPYVNIACTDTAILVLTITQPTTYTFSHTACSSYTWHGTTYTTSGTYTFDTLNKAGCDSLITLNLTIKQPATGAVTQTACGSYIWHGTTYTTSGTYTFDTLNKAGCDSLITLNLTIKQSTTGAVTQTACGSYTWHGTTYTSSGTYTFDSLNIAGCDSLTTLNLTITTPVTPSVSIAAYPSGSIVAGNAVTFTATPSNGGGAPVYQWIKNGAPIGTNSNTYSDTVLINGDVIACILFANNACQSSGIANSNNITAIVTPSTLNYVWTGAVSTDWSIAGNWSNNVLPTAGVSVTIPSSTSNQPVLSTDISIADLTLNGSIDLNNHTFTIGGAVTGNGVLKGSVNSSLTLAGNSASISFDANNNTLNNLTITGAATLSSPLNVYGVLNLASGSFNTGGYLTLKSTSISQSAVVAPVGGSLIGIVTVERFIPKGLKAYRDLGAEVANAGSIFNNWQESGNKPSGYGMYITGLKGAAPGGVDVNTGLDKTATGEGSIYSYGTGNWPGITNTRTNQLDPFMGYRVLVRGDRTYNIYNPDQPLMNAATTIRAKGSIVTGDVYYTTAGITNTTYFGNTAYSSNTTKLLTGNGNFSMVANPFVSPIDWEGIYNNAGTKNITSSYWYFDPTFLSGGYATYVTYNAVSHINSNPSASKLNKYIQPGMAFFVQNINSNNPTLSITESNKVTNSTKTAVFRTEAPNYIHASLWKNVNGENTNIDGAVAAFNSSFTKLIGDKDSKKLINGGENIYITQSNTDLSIAGLPVPTENEEIKLNLSQLIAGTNYQLQLDASQFTTSGLEVFIKDKLLNRIVPAAEGINFTTTKEADTYQERFSIVFKAAKVNPIIVKGTVSIYPNPASNSKFNLQLSNLEKGTYTVRVINSLGVEVMSSTISNEIGTATKTIPTKGLSAAVYTVQVVGKAGTYNTELIIKN